MYREFSRIGRDLFIQGLNSSHSGNMSVRLGDRLVITRRGSMLGSLEEKDLVETGIEKNDSHITLASTEIGVHRAIYRNTPALAIVHAHPVYATALSLVDDEIIPIDSEGQYMLHRIPVIGLEHTVGSEEAARILPEYLREYKIVMIRGHGSFATGQLIEEAYQWTSSLENICRIIYLTRTLKGEIKEDKNKKYNQW
ncbi:MAG: fuculose phosphate aldolase [Firmicutes bacterium HGW-Firmicutes-14]|nr:MAG: fuculose phosphate aldolase [Firmicutes bacterium HGW-Firmicutes-14]